ncbi:MAG: FAD-dependent oxidoreductase [Rhodobacteraceae bacterium]|nr:FAD-dependent oxidoreductase [Paracoccaceae bacterium]
MAPTDVLVIGGGIVGQISAIRLAEAGARVTLVDAAVNAGSTANAGSLHVQMQSRFMRLYPDQVPNIEASLPFYKAAADEWVALDAELGPFELVRKGGLMLAESADQMRFLEGKSRREVAKGLRVDLLDRAALDRIAPWLGPQIVGAELCHDEGKLNPLVANARLGARARALGVSLVQDWIAGLEVSASGIVAVGERVTYRADRVVIAAAWGAGALVPEARIPTRQEPLHMNITEAASAQISHLVQHAERSITLKQFSSGQIVIGGGWEACSEGERVVPRVQADSLLGNVALAGRLAPAIGGLRVIRTWAGMNTTVDGASVIGPLPRTERVVMAVPGDAGYTLGPLVAQMAAVCVTGAAQRHDLAQFSPVRFLK